MTAAARVGGAVAACLLSAGWGISQAAQAEEGGAPVQAPVHMHDDHPVRADQELGQVDFRVSCNGKVRESFDRALALMHHMMYEQARSAFEAVGTADPGCAMAHWGVATTLFQPLWGTRPSDDDLMRGWDLIDKAKTLGPKSDRERMLVEATAGFFREPDSAAFRTRINRWTEGMVAAFEAHSDDADTAALYALSRLTLAQAADDRDHLHEEAEQVLRKVWEKNPTHPGAIHYSIHATDADGRAEHALDMVEAYGTIAPEVPHALHMPSHIYVRLGAWPEVIDWNRQSADAALRTPPVEGAITHHYVHALDYLLYAHLQRGEDDHAGDVLTEAKDAGRHQGSFISAYHLAAMPARLAVERQQWDAARSLEPRTPAYLPWDQSAWAEGLTWYARGLGAVHGDDRALAQQAERRLEALRKRAAAGGDDAFATYIEVDRRILAGWIAHRWGEADHAVELMRSATALEGTIEKHPVTPGALLPPNEALGDLLTALDRPAEALAAYRAGDRSWPGRYNTLLGAARAAQAAGDQDGARAHYARLLEVAGDSARAGVAEARRAVSGISTSRGPVR
jgi:hypothetical protein